MPVPRTRSSGKDTVHRHGEVPLCTKGLHRLGVMTMEFGVVVHRRTLDCHRQPYRDDQCWATSCLLGTRHVKGVKCIRYPASS